MQSLMNRFSGKVADRLCQGLCSQATPFSDALSGARPKVVLLVHLRNFEEDADFPVCVAPVPVEELPGCAVLDAIQDPRFHMRTMVVPNFGGLNIQVKHIRMENVMHIDGLADACVRITSLMSRDVQMRKLDPKEFKGQLAGMDVQGIVVYCSPFAERSQFWLELITGEMLDAMWGAVSVDPDVQKKRKLV